MTKQKYSCTDAWGVANKHVKCSNSLAIKDIQITAACVCVWPIKWKKNNFDKESGIQ